MVPIGTHRFWVVWHAAFASTDPSDEYILFPVDDKENLSNLAHGDHTARRRRTQRRCHLMPRIKAPGRALTAGADQSCACSRTGRSSTGEQRRAGAFVARTVTTTEREAAASESQRGTRSHRPGRAAPCASERREWIGGGLARMPLFPFGRRCRRPGAPLCFCVGGRIKSLAATTATPSAPRYFHDGEW